MKDFIEIPVSSILKESVTEIPKYCDKPYIVYRNPNHCNKKVRVNTYFYRIKFLFLPEKVRLCVYYAPDTNIFCRSKIGGYCDRDDRAEYEMDGCTYVGLLSNFLCPEMELNLGTNKRTIIIDNETGKLQVV